MKLELEIFSPRWDGVMENISICLIFSYKSQHVSPAFNTTHVYMHNTTQHKTTHVHKMQACTKDSRPITGHVQSTRQKSLTDDVFRYRCHMTLSSFSMYTIHMYRFESFWAWNYRGINKPWTDRHDSHQQQSFIIKICWNKQRLNMNMPKHFCFCLQALTNTQTELHKDTQRQTDRQR